MNTITVDLSIASIRSRGRAGGVIFAGVTPDKARYVVKCDYKVLPNSTSVDKGQRWSITGTLETWNDETQITAQTATMLRPSGRNVVEWIAGSQHCAGIGLVKARDLYDRFGLSLIDHISNWDIEALVEVVTEQAAYRLCEAFEQYKVAADLQWLDQIGLPRTVGTKVLEFYKEMKLKRVEGEARVKVEANPYVLISFAERWQIVDEIARTQFGIAANDPRRLEAAVEDTLYSILSNKHTCIPIGKAKSGLYYRLHDAQLVIEALALKKPSTQYLRFGDYLQSSGMYLIEKYIAERLKKIAAGEKKNQQSLLASTADQWADRRAENEITGYESEQGLTLTTEQREAVITSATNNLTLILGGAGTGKTTVLKAVYRVLESYDSDVKIHQIALAGRAAQRMKEVTGRDSMTIAAFIRALENGSRQVGPGTMVVLDEASMVDAILMFKLLRNITPGTRLMLVGDPSQLPPIGPGLVFQALVGCQNIPQTMLKVTKRQSLESGIPHVANAIQCHKIPTFAHYLGIGRGVSFISCSDNHINATVVQTYRELGGTGCNFSVQILSTTNNGYGGVEGLNNFLHTSYRENAEHVQWFDPVFGVVNVLTKKGRLSLKVGDLVMFTKNDYDLDLRNGSLGIIVEALPVVNGKSQCCICKFDGVLYRFNSEQVSALQHAYAITTHKSQGSQFERVIIPIRRNKLLDQALVYTAVTRAVEQVVFVGNYEAALAAIEAPASVTQRHVRLPLLMIEQMR